MRMIKKILSSREVPQIQFTSKFICIFIARRRFLQMPIVGSICIKYFWPCLSGTYYDDKYFVTFYQKIFKNGFDIFAIHCYFAIFKVVIPEQQDIISLKSCHLQSTSTSFKQKMQKLKITSIHLILR